MRIAGRAALPALGLGLAAIAVVAIVGLAVGTVPIDVLDVVRALGAAAGVLPDGVVRPWIRIVVVELRLPRLVAAVLVGAGLATTGTALQAVFRNPLADPAVLGIASGAAFGGSVAVYTSASRAGAWVVPAWAFVGATLAGSVVYLAGVRGGRSGTATLLLVGVAVGSLMSAGTSLVLSFALEDYRVAAEVMRWLLGGLGGRAPVHLAMGVLPVVASVGLVASHARELDALLLSEIHAASLGVDVHRVRKAIVLAAALGSAGAVSIAGVVPFVGLVVPHLLRRVVGPLHGHLVPASILGGSLFVLTADLCARRAVAPAELQLGAVTSALGAPLFLFLLLRRPWEVSS